MVPVLSITAMAVAVAYVMLAFHGAGDAPMRWVTLAVVVAPYLLVLVLYWRRSLSHAYALATGSAAAALVALGPFAALSLLFFGFTLGNRDQQVGIGLLAAFVLLQVPLAVAAIRGYRGLSTERRDRRAWLAGLLLPAVYVGVAWIGLKSVADLEQAARRSAEANYRQAGKDVAYVHRCLAQYASETGHFPETLAEVGPGGTGCLDAHLAGGQASGYRLRYLPGLPAGASPAPRIYNLCSEALSFSWTGFFPHAADERGLATRYAWDVDRGSPSCAQVWAEALDRRVRYCLVAYATLHPARGYPTSLLEIGESGAGCLRPYRPEDSQRVEGAAAESGGGGWVGYRAGAPGADGRIVSFELTSRARIDGDDL